MQVKFTWLRIVSCAPPGHANCPQEHHRFRRDPLMKLSLRPVGALSKLHLWGPTLALPVILGLQSPKIIPNAAFQWSCCHGERMFESTDSSCQRSRTNLVPKDQPSVEGPHIFHLLRGLNDQSTWVSNRPKSLKLGHGWDAALATPSDSRGEPHMVG